MWPEGEKTQQLLNDARDGKSEAVNDLLQRHREALHRMIQLRLDAKIRQRIDVSDVLQDVMVEANRRLQGYLEQPQMAFHLWLRQIAKDRIIDAHRRHRVSGKRSVDKEQPLAAPSGDPESAMLLAANLRDPEMTPAAVVAQQEMVRCVEDAIGKLDEQDCEIIVMRHYEHLSNQDVAQALGLSEPAASMRYLRAMRRLREMLADDANSQG